MRPACGVAGCTLTLTHTACASCPLLAGGVIQTT